MGVEGVHLSYATPNDAFLANSHYFAKVKLRILGFLLCYNIMIYDHFVQQSYHSSIMP
jgi:hypothetical protein